LAIGFRLGMTGAIRSAVLLLHRTAVIWEGAPMKEYIGAP